MKRFLIIAALLLSGCATQSVPVARHFPGAPEDLLATCPDIKLINESTDKLSDVLSVVVTNYGQYAECKIKLDAWIEWYHTQKSIFEEVK